MEENQFNQNQFWHVTRKTEDICQNQTSRRAYFPYKGGITENDWILQTGIDGNVDISIWYTSVPDDTEEWKSWGETTTRRKLKKTLKKQTPSHPQFSE